MMLKMQNIQYNQIMCECDTPCTYMVVNEQKRQKNASSAACKHTNTVGIGPNTYPQL